MGGGGGRREFGVAGHPISPIHNMRVLVVVEQFFIISKMNKTSCFKSRHFINIYIINRTLHGRLGIRILSSRAESISHE